MTEMTLQSLERDPQLLSRRLARFVRSRASAKTLANLIGCDVRTAENIRSGHWPIARHWCAIWLAYGDDVLEAVFRPHEAAERLAREVRELELEIAAKKAAAVALDVDGPRLAQVAAAHEDRSAELTILSSARTRR
jgi:hypothetical protein